MSARAALQLWLAAISFVCPLSAQSEQNIFPMEKGTFWIYAGAVEWGEGGEVRSKKLSWEVTVLDSVERGRFKAVVLRGDPRDLTWYSEDRKRSCYLLTIVDNQNIYRELLDSQCALPPVPLSEKEIRGELVFKLQAQKGDLFGRDTEREDSMYAWDVQDRRRVTLNQIKGIPRDRTYTEYALAYRTAPEHVFTDYVPGIGFTSFIYGHHGTVSNVDVKLVEFRSPPTGYRRP